MLSSKHCRNRAEALRFSLVITRDPAAAARLRKIIEKYRVLADCARETEPTPVDETQAAFHRLAELVVSSGTVESKAVFKPLRVDALRGAQLNILRGKNALQSPREYAPTWPAISQLGKHLERTIQHYRRQIPLSHSGREPIH
jgi:hypothetical protein